MADHNIERQDADGDDFFDSESEGKGAELMRKMEALEKEKAQLLHENKEMKEKLENMVAEMDELKKDKEALDDKLGAMRIEIEVEEQGKKAMESIVGRASDLEVEVTQLQHDLISAMSEGEEANVEIAELKKTLGEKEERVMNLLKEVEELKRAKTDNEKVVREMERKIGVMEVRASEVKSEKTRVEQGMREKLDEKEVELLGQQRKVEDLEFVIAKNGAELVRCFKDKKSMGKALKLSGDKARAIELKMVHMHKEVGEAERAIGVLKEKAVETVHGVLDREIGGGGKRSKKGQWPLLAMGSSGAIVGVAAAMAYASYCGGRGRG